MNDVTCSKEISSPEITIAITSRNRADSLLRCLLSLGHLAPLALEILVVDDGSEEPFETYIKSHIPADFPWPIEIRRHNPSTGYIPARNELNTAAQSSFILCLDDDTCILKNNGIAEAIGVMRSHPEAACIALMQTEADGTPRAAYNQPCASEVPCFTATFLGYGHILRKEAFLKAGPYRELFFFYREEMEMSKRLHDAGYEILYLPQARVAHLVDSRGRDERRHLRFNARNSCFDAIYNEPLPMALLSVPARILNYIRWRGVPTKYYNFSDAGGVQWLIREIVVNLPAIWKERKPLKWSTYRKWKRLQREKPEFPL